MVNSGEKYRQSGEILNRVTYIRVEYCKHYQVYDHMQQTSEQSGNGGMTLSALIRVLVF